MITSNPAVPPVLFFSLLRRVSLFVLRFSVRRSRAAGVAQNPDWLDDASSFSFIFIFFSLSRGGCRYNKEFR